MRVYGGAALGANTLTGAQNWNMGAETTVVSALTLTPATAGAAPFGFGQTSSSLNGFYDTFTAMGYNLGNYSPFTGGTSNQPSWVMAFENDFYDLTNHTMEWYLNYRSADNSTVVDFRPMYVDVWRTANSSHTAELQFDVGDANGSFKVFAKAVDASNPNLLVNSVLVQMRAADVNITKGLLTLSNVANASSTFNLGSNADTGTLGQMRVKGGSGKFNFQVGMTGVTTNNTLEFTPSTAADGATYSAPALGLTAAGTMLAGKAAAAAALATNATTGFLVIPGSAGLQTGTPANAGTGQFAMAYDSTNNKLMVYDGGWLSTAALT